MKLVINKCYGGFGISDEATLLLIEQNSPFVQKKPAAEYFHKPYNSENFKALRDGFLQADRWGGCVYKDGFVYYLDEFTVDCRSDPALIQAVETLGTKASGSCADLQVVEIPDGTDFIIKEYDGFESVVEPYAVYA